jgi:hypothetical protein
MRIRATNADCRSEAETVGVSTLLERAPCAAAHAVGACRVSVRRRIGGDEDIEVPAKPHGQHAYREAAALVAQVAQPFRADRGIRGIRSSRDCNENVILMRDPCKGRVAE